VFFSTIEKQLDAKRRMVLPAEFREAASGPFGGVFCFPSIETDCIEAGGQALFDTYKKLIDGLPFGDPLRSALETCFYGGVVKLAYDTAGRITLPDSLCQMFGLTDQVQVVGMGDRFQIWSPQAHRANVEAARGLAKAEWAALRTKQREAALT
jgi:MraZ protein